GKSWHICREYRRECSTDLLSRDERLWRFHGLRRSIPIEDRADLVIETFDYVGMSLNDQASRLYLEPENLDGKGECREIHSIGEPTGEPLQRGSWKRHRQSHDGHPFRVEIELAG